VGPIPYPVVNTFFDEAYPPGVLNYWKSSFMPELADDAIDVLVERFASTPSIMNSAVIEHFHGAVCRVGVSDTAVPHRAPGYNLGIFAEWINPAETDENVAWTRQTYAALEPHFGGLRYVNYLDADDADAAQAAWGPNYERLREVKRRVDPENLFHLNTNIEPA
jgi:FAD/FMN-containing dehydrogenase